jgi:signal transduction histidine kinase
MNSLLEQRSVSKELEKDLLLYGILVSIGYQLFMVLMSLVPVINPSMALLNMFITAFLFFIYLLAQRLEPHPGVLLALHGLAVAGFTFFWMNYGGLAGTIPSFLCIYSAFIIVCSRGFWRVFILGSLVILISLFMGFPSLFGMTSLWEPEKTNPFQQFVDYLIMGALILIFILHMKRKFIFYREAVSNRYRQLDRIAQTLHQQNQELATRQEETRAINENLESLVQERTNANELKNIQLAEYAFINAHMLRAPLCRILGLISLMEKEPDRYRPDQLSRLKVLAQQIDQQVREINVVVS